MINLQPGDFVPHFSVGASTNPSFAFDTVGGRRAVLCFFGDLAAADSTKVLDVFMARRQWLRERRAHVFAVSATATDQAVTEIGRRHDGGIVLFWDFDGAVGRLLGVQGWRGSLVIDENLRLLAAVALDDVAAHVDAVSAILDRLSRAAGRSAIARQAPVLIVPDVLDTALCRKLIQVFESDGGRDSGYMNEKDGRTIGVVNHQIKRRRDVYIADPDLRAQLLRLVGRRVISEIRKACASDVTRMERFLIARYDGETGGHFSAHRDNTTPATAHRKFAVTINLNAEEFEGGELRFPEYSRDTYRAPTGGAVVFSCSLMHEALPVTKGRRYAFLPFLYDESGWSKRQASKGSIVWEGDTAAVPSGVAG